MTFKSGFVSLIGHPNVGKSTLLNSLIKEKIAIISPKAQTTRNVIRGIYTTNNEQIIFLDTPGIHKAQNELGTLMNKSARSAFYDVEAVLLISDVTIENADNYGDLLEDLKRVECPLFLVLNKIDLISKNQLLEITAQWSKVAGFAGIIPISALTSENVDRLLEELINILPQGPKYYPDDMITDNPESFVVAEIIREKILSFTREEIPHSVAVVIEKMNETSKRLNIYATIIVERDSQKGIIIGKGGKMLRKIGTSSRMEISRLFGIDVRLETFVRVEKDWRNSSHNLKEFGYKD